MKSVYFAVRTGSLNKAVCASYLKGSINFKPHTYEHLGPIKGGKFLDEMNYYQLMRKESALPIYLKYL
jgi:hypothetical protein